MSGPAPAAAEETVGEAADDAGRSLPPGLPEGVIELARALCRGLPTALDPTRGSAAAGDRSDTAVLVDLLTAPLRLDGDWPAPEPPLPVEGGWIQVEITDDDRHLLEAVLARWSDRGPEGVARSCQELRLPVSPYRPPPPPPRRQPAADRPAATATVGPTASPAGATDRTADRATVPPGGDPDRVVGSLVIDLSTHWAGPLATKLLAEAGATVIKLDPRCRPDGFGSRPGLYRHLNGGKEIIDLDLRQDGDRARFEALLAEADLVVESFSRRVMANLGYGPSRLGAINPELSQLSIKAYPAGSPEGDWLGFGPGVHAWSGLGLIDGTPRTTPVAYPDFLTGLAGFGRAVELLGRSAPPVVAEVSLAATIEPLGRTRPTRPAGSASGGSGDG